jgi:hypothetical protein
MKGVHHDSNWVPFAITSEGIEILKIKMKPPKESENSG